MSTPNTERDALRGLLRDIRTYVAANHPLASRIDAALATPTPAAPDSEGFGDQLWGPSYQQPWAAQDAGRVVDEVTDEMVERACRAYQGPIWPNLFTPNRQQHCREDMRAVLTAALTKENTP